MDIRYSGNHDILTDRGFCNMVYQLLNLKPGTGHFTAPVCSTWVFMCLDGGAKAVSLFCRGVLVSWIGQEKIPQVSCSLYYPFAKSIVNAAGNNSLQGPGVQHCGARNAHLVATLNQCALQTSWLRVYAFCCSSLKAKVSGGFLSSPLGL